MFLLLTFVRINDDDDDHHHHRWAMDVIVKSIITESLKFSNYDSARDVSVSIFLTLCPMLDWR